MSVVDVLLAPMQWCVRFPFLPLIPGLLLVAAALAVRPQPPRIVLWSGVLWLAYAAWEATVFLWTRSQPADGGAIIRADLLLIAPVLYVTSILAVVLWAMKRG